MFFMMIIKSSRKGTILFKVLVWDYKKKMQHILRELYSQLKFKRH